MQRTIGKGLNKMLGFRWDAGGSDPGQYGSLAWHEGADTALLNVLQSADYTCQTEGCGFRAAPFPNNKLKTDTIYLGEDVTGYMQVSHLDGNHDNNNPGNLRCVCPYCHLSDHPIESVLEGRADLIYAPHISQLEVNAIAMVINRTLRLDTHVYHQDARSVLDIIMKDSDEHMSKYIKEYPALTSSREDQQAKFCISIKQSLTAGDAHRYLFEPLRLFPRADFFTLAHDFWNEREPLPQPRDWKMAAHG